MGRSAGLEVVTSHPREKNADKYRNHTQHFGDVLARTDRETGRTHGESLAFEKVLPAAGFLLGSLVLHSVQTLPGGKV